VTKDGLVQSGVMQFSIIKRALLFSLGYYNASTGKVVIDSMFVINQKAKMVVIAGTLTR
jgi:hypothetical protein